MSNLYKKLSKIFEDFDNIIFLGNDQEQESKIYEIRMNHFQTVKSELENFIKNNKLIDNLEPKKNKKNINLIHKDPEIFIDRVIKDYVVKEFWNNKKIITTNDIEYLDTVKSIFMKLYQIEYKLKELWEKPKSIINCYYVISLSELSEELRKKILENIPKEQEEEWKKLFFMKEEYDLEQIKTNDKYKNIPIDTKYFDEVLLHEILTSFNDINEKANGILIHSENLQALNHLKSL